MKNMRLRKSDNSKHFNWLMGADMYLAASFLLSQELSCSYRCPKDLGSLNDDQRIDKKCGFTSSNVDYEMLMPIIFNLKHGIELYLKALTMKINPQQKYPESHDLLDILNNLILEIKENKGSSILSTFNKEVRGIIEKYYYGLYAFSKDKNNPDKNNEAERYPEHCNCNCYKANNLYDIDFSILLKGIKKDIQFIQKFLREDVYKKLSN